MSAYDPKRTCVLETIFSKIVAIIRGNYLLMIVNEGASNSMHPSVAVLEIINSSQLIPASRRRWTIAIAVRYQSNSSFCRVLKSSSSLA